MKTKLSPGRGSGLIVVIVTMMVIAILVAAMGSLAMANTNMAVHQVKVQKANYLAVSGVDLVTAALVHRAEGDPLTTTKYASYFGTNTSHVVASIPSNIIFGPGNITGVMQDGTVTVTVGYEDDTYRWVVVEATAILDDGSGTTSKAKLRFRADNPDIYERVN